MNSNSNFSENFPLIKKDGSELQAIADKYPWCSVAQLSLLTHYQRTNSEKFEQHATKAALFFNNTNWLNWQLHLLSKDEPIENGRPEGSQTDVVPVMLNENIEQLILNDSPGTSLTEEKIPEESHTFKEQEIQEERANLNGSTEANYTEEIMPAEPETIDEPEIQEENLEQPFSNTLPETNFTGEIMHAETEHSAELEKFEEPEIQEENTEQAIFNGSSGTNPTLKSEESETFAEPKIQDDNTEQPIFNDSPGTNPNLEIVPEEQETFTEKEIHEENTEQPIFNGTPGTNPAGEIVPEEQETSAEPEIQEENSVQPVLNISALNSTNNTEEIAFEPLHTTDYFASQGIRLTDEPVSHDKLGTQMKSFTEWLKSMKKIHKENLPAGDEQTDKNIQQIAEHSNVVAEVVTEAMADVLIKQNKNEKAIEVYEKLSLINPSKSAYFAAKIESLSTGR